MLRVCLLLHSKGQQRCERSAERLPSNDDLDPRRYLI
eukprot:COSAG03_NODE_25965_length_262_cov_0.638037_1_plen_36_part_10